MTSIPSRRTVHALAVTGLIASAVGTPALAGAPMGPRAAAIVLGLGLRMEGTFGPYRRAPAALASPRQQRPDPRCANPALSCPAP